MITDLVLSFLLAGIFFVSGGGKLAGMKQVVAQFERWRYAPSVRIAGGALEVLGAALLTLPDLTLYGALILLGVLVTAVYTHVSRERLPSHAAPATVLLVLVVVLAFLRGGAAAGPGGIVFRALFG